MPAWTTDVVDEEGNVQMTPGTEELVVALRRKARDCEQIAADVFDGPTGLAAWVPLANLLKHAANRLEDLYVETRRAGL